MRTIMSVSGHKTEKEFEIYRQREMLQLESDFDKAVKQLTQKAGNEQE